MIRVISAASGSGGGGTSGVGNASLYIGAKAPSPAADESVLWVRTLGNGQPRFDISKSRLVAPTFTPGIPLSGVYAWYAAHVIADIEDGQTFGSWPDLSGNGRHLVQATTSKWPTLVEDALGGLPIVRFSESAQTALALTGLSLPQPYEVYMVCKVRTDANASAANLIRTASSDGVRWAAAAGGGARALQLIMPSQRSGSATSLPLSFNAYRIVANGASSKLLATAADTSLIAATNAGSDALSQIQLGSVSGLATDIDIAELIVTNGLQSAEARSAIGSYLTSTWGVA